MDFDQIKREREEAKKVDIEHLRSALDAASKTDPKLFEVCKPLLLNFVHMVNIEQFLGVGRTEMHEAMLAIHKVHFQ